MAIESKPIRVDIFILEKLEKINKNEVRNKRKPYTKSMMISLGMQEWIDNYWKDNQKDVYKK